MAEVSLGELRAAVAGRLRDIGFGDRSARLIGEHYLDSEMRGAVTHGLERLRWLAGLPGLDPRAQPVLERRTDGLATWNGAGAVGYVALAEALDAECEVPLAGARVVVVEDCFPTGRLGWFGERVAARGRLCLLTATSPARLVHPDGGPPALATSPLCLAVPGTPPAVVDVSMGRITFGDVLAAAAKGERLPEGTGVRPDGSPEDDPAEIVANRAGIRAFGGDEVHKGFALAVLVELLAAAVSSSPGFAAVALLAAPVSDAAARLRATVGDRRFPGDASRTRREAAQSRGSVEVDDDLWEWLRR
jgi:delta1-piperideine-2-carboxylate reductase